MVAGVGFEPTTSGL